MGLINPVLSDILSFKRENFSIWVLLKLDNYSPSRPNSSFIRFKFDTGAVGILLSRETFKYLGYSSLSPTRSITIRGVERTISKTGIFRRKKVVGIPGKEYIIPTFQIAGTFYAESPSVRVPDKPNGCNNLLGMSVLCNRYFLVDIEDSVIMFGHKDANGRTIPPMSAKHASDIAPSSAFNNRITNIYGGSK